MKLNNRKFPFQNTNPNPMTLEERKQIEYTPTGKQPSFWLTALNFARKTGWVKSPDRKSMPTGTPESKKQKQSLRIAHTVYPDRHYKFNEFATNIHFSKII